MNEGLAIQMLEEACKALSQDVEAMLIVGIKSDGSIFFRAHATTLNDAATMARIADEPARQCIENMMRSAEPRVVKPTLVRPS